MIWTLKICMGIFLGLCGSNQTFDYLSKEECYREQVRLEKVPGVSWAICFPKGESK